MLTTPKAGLPGRPAAPSRKDSLRASLPEVVDALRRRRADLIGDSVIAEYVALDWLEWHGGTLRLTVVGQNLCAGARAPG